MTSPKSYFCHSSSSSRNSGLLALRCDQPSPPVASSLLHTSGQAPAPASSPTHPSCQAPSARAATPWAHRDTGGSEEGVGARGCGCREGEALDLARESLDSPGIGTGEADILERLGPHPCLTLFEYAQTSLPRQPSGPQPLLAQPPIGAWCPLTPHCTRGQHWLMGPQASGRLTDRKASAPGSPLRPSCAQGHAIS